MPESGMTRDRLERFGLVIDQPVDGYRFSLDPILLSAYACRGDERQVVDLGCGGGILPLILSKLAPQCQIIGLESDADAAGLAVHNVSLNQLKDQIRIIEGDVCAVRSLLPGGLADLVVSNPPYRPMGQGRLSPNPARRTACHESTAGIDAFCAAAHYLIRPGGRIAMIYSAERLTDLLSAAAGQRLIVREMRPVYDRSDRLGKLVMVTLAKGGAARTMTLLPPLLIRDHQGEYTAEVQQILYGTPQSLEGAQDG